MAVYRSVVILIIFLYFGFAVVSAEDDPLSMYYENLSNIKRNDVTGYYQLGLWAKDNRLPDQALEMFNLTLRMSPDHPGARRELGYERFDDRWLKKEDVPQYRETLNKVKDFIKTLQNTQTKPEQEADVWAEMSRIDGRCKVTPLVEVLKQGSPDGSQLSTMNERINGYAIDELGRLNDERAVKPLVKIVLHNKKSDYREKALASVVALKPVGNKQSEQLFIDALATDNRLVGIRAVYGLQALESQRAIGHLVQKLYITYEGFGRAHIFFGDQFTYVKDFDAVPVLPGVAVADPQVDTLLVGTALEAKILRVDRVITVEEERNVLGNALNHLTGQDFGTDHKKWSVWWQESQKGKK